MTAVRAATTRLRAAAVELDVAALRGLGAAMLALGVVLPHVPGDPGLPCPLRATTGVPCPMCGMTTSVKALLRGRFGDAWSANPFGFFVVAAAVVLLARPSLRRVRVPLAVVLVVAAASWAFQLRRFDYL